MMRQVRFPWAAVLAILSVTLVACGDDDDGGSSGGSSPEAACNNYCACSFASSIPNCQSTCVDGIGMAKDPGACASCTGSSSCSELENQACASACQ